MEKEVIEKKIVELNARKQEFINSVNKMREELIMLQRNVDGCDGAIISLNEMLKDIELVITPSEEIKA